MSNSNWNYPTTVWFGKDRIMKVFKSGEEVYSGYKI